LGYKYLKDEDLSRIKKRKKAIKFTASFFFYSISFILISLILIFGMFFLYKKITDNSINLDKNEKIKEVPIEGDKKIENENNVSKSKLKNSSKILEYKFSEWNKKNPLNLWIINKNNPIENAKIENELVFCDNKQVHKIIADPLKAMISYAKENKIDIWIVSGYRDLKTQETLFENQKLFEKKRGLNDEEAEEMAQFTVAKSGHSEHNLGIAVDFNGANKNFESTAAFSWLLNNAHKYGFIRRYAENKKAHTGVNNEPWHWRYVGKEYAEDIKNSCMCLEEYILKNMLKM